MSLRNWWTIKVFNKKAQWTEKHLQQRVMTTTDSRVEAVIITMGGVDANIVTVQPTEGKDPEVEAVIVRGGTVPVLLVGDLGQEIGDRGPGTGVQETEDPGQGQGDGHVHPEEDRGIGELKLFNRCETLQLQQIFLLFLLRKRFQCKLQVQK